MCLSCIETEAHHEDLRRDRRIARESAPPMLRASPKRQISLAMREERIAVMRQQIADGSLVIRFAHELQPDERERYGFTAVPVA